MLSIRGILFLLLCYPFIHVRAQLSAALRGTVYLSEQSETLTGAVIYDMNDRNNAAVSDEDGNYLLKINAGQHTLICSFIGMSPDTLMINPGPGEIITHNFRLNPESKTLHVVVVSAGKFEQKIEDLTVSMEVIRPALIESKKTTNISTALEQVPGLTVLDGEPQIRSGSGFSFGVGSRVAILVDGLPLLVGDQGRPEWSFIPVENIEQVEVIKGASSVLYGSSALSGVINVRTTYPKEKPETKAELYYGQYDAPAVPGTKWWKGAAPVSGFSFLHSERMGKNKNLDVVIGGQVLDDHNYIGEPLKVKYIPIPVDSTLNDNDVATRSGRVNFSLRYRPEKQKRLSVGLNGNFMLSHDNFTLIWLNDSTGLYRAFPGTMTITDSKLYYVDPFLTYFSPGGLKHTVHARIFHSQYDNSNRQSNRGTVYYGEYQAYQELSSLDGLHFTGGFLFNKIRSKAELYALSGSADNSSNNYAAYMQLDKKFGSILNLSGGVRGEYYAINNQENVLKPIFRGGLSMTLTPGTFLRLSYGQGYRYPTITEKFIFTNEGGIYVFPNPALQPETSRGEEVGLKQGFKIRDFYGFADIAAFWEEYANTIEYTYALWRPDSAGFRFVNTGDSRVRGYDISLQGGGKLSKNIFLTLLAGYTYTLPQAVDPDYVYAVDHPSPGFTPTQLSYSSTSTDTSDHFLKYRFRNTLKGDAEITWKSFSIGYSFRHYSFMENIDKVFYDIDMPGRLPTGIKKYREVHPNGSTVSDARVRVKIKEHFSAALLVNNLFNLSYSLRPLKIESPRTISLQVTATL